MLKWGMIGALILVTGTASANIVSETYVTNIKNALNQSKENVSNKVTTLNAESTDDHYPSARAVNTALGDKVSLNADETINGVKTFVDAPIVPTPPLPTE